MAGVARRVINKIRGKKKQAIPHASTRDKKIAEYYGQKRLESMWERDKAIVRDQNFVKMQKGLEKYREEQRAEQERQDEIKAMRLENLAKARKALKKKRSQNV